MSSIAPTSLINLCDTNFKLCRLAGVIENNACMYYVISVGSGSLINIITLILAICVFVFFEFFNSAFKTWEVKFEGQRPTRGSKLYKTHFFILGAYVLVWGLSESVAPTVGRAQNFFIALKYVFLNAGETILFCITLLDAQLIPDGIPTLIGSIVVAIIVGLISFIPLAESVAASSISFFGLGLPIGFVTFHTIVMFCVCITRKIWRAIFFLILMWATNAGPILIEMYASKGLCTISVGWFTSGSLAILILGFYRLIISFYYPCLKRNEMKDCLGSKKVYLGQQVDDENVPCLIDGEDYTYEYTYTDVDDSDDDRNDLM